MIALESPRRGMNVAERTLGIVLLCAGAFGLELLGGSGFPFAALTMAYVASVMFAVRCQGGLKTIYGAVVFYYSVQHVLASQVFKIFLGESPESRLPVPVPAILTEILMMLGFAAAGIAATMIRPNRDRPLFPPLTNPQDLRKLALGTTALALIRIFSTKLLGNEGAGPIHMLGILDFLAIAAAVASAVTESGGKRLTSKFVYASTSPLIFFSLIGGNRSGFVLCGLAVVLAGWAFGYRFRIWQAFLAGTLGFLMFFIVSPYSLTVRGVSRTGDVVRDFNTSMDVLSDVVSHPLKYQVESDEVIRVLPKEFIEADYFKLTPGNASNVLNRYSLLKPNAMIVEETMKTGTIGWANITPALPRLLPSIFGTNKYIPGGTGNAIAHRVKGLVNPEDISTGITIGITADSFAAFAWKGVFLIPFAFLLLNITTSKLLTRLDMRRNVFALAIFSQSFHTLSEEPSGTYITNGLYNAVLYGIGIYLAVQTAKLIDFHYLRPRRISVAEPTIVDTDPLA